jgi:transcription antitermination factor NusG
MSIDTDAMTVDVQVSMFGRETLASVGISQVSPADY